MEGRSDNRHGEDSFERLDFTIFLKVWMVLHILLVTIIPFSLLTWLNTCIYNKLTHKANVLRRTGQNCRRRELRVGRLSIRRQTENLLNEPQAE